MSGLVNTRIGRSPEGSNDSRSMVGGMTRTPVRPRRSGVPMKKSAPNGSATSVANQVPMVSPVIRRTISPMR